MESRPFEVVVQGSHSIPIPMEIAIPFLDKGQRRVKVKATFEGKSLEFFAALQKRKEQVFIMFSKNHQKTLGIFPNDYFRLQFFEDNSKYGVDMPEEFEAVLSSDYEASQVFESLTAGKKRGIIYMIIRYKNPQTRIDKSLILCENLKRGVRDNKELLKPL
ncbi:YdeI/OmpD-associated family protein [Flagellimonas flava]|uniref:Bacteriocin-protection, YdeI or OmpD-Associated n=1 Tax=Flagellimonas flava TaxID=570519 RepID=A0A1M5I3G8_9FLAO|nr:YdeI/OmpD-associated family protein [Allomuricauda flava]SHG22530.1 Bacteriocin-protection, YdeI or OmpD-Associated [Allomuricauda flava]